MTTPRSDGDLIRASLDEPELFEVVFERHHGRIYRYLARRVGPDTARDLASDVFVAAFAQRDRFREDAVKADPWLYGIAANLARRQARTWRRARRASQRMHRDGIWLDPEVEDRVDAERLRSALIAGLRVLRGPEREVLLLFALSDLTYAEIAEALDIPNGTVRSRLARGRHRIQAALRAAGYDREADLLLEGGDDESR